MLQIVGKQTEIGGITVMCGRETGKNPAYIKAAHDLGQIFAENGIAGYFGGSQFGMMGAFASSMIGHGGRVIGIMPRFLKDVEKPLDSIETIWVDDFPQRLRYFRNPDVVDAIVNLPGGIGTDAEHADFATLDKHEQLGLPNILVNVEGFYDCRIMDFRRRAEEGFLWDSPAKRLYVANSVEEVLPMIQAHYAGEPVQNIFTVPLDLTIDRIQQAVRGR